MTNIESQTENIFNLLEEDKKLQTMRQCYYSFLKHGILSVLLPFGVKPVMGFSTMLFIAICQDFIDGKCLNEAYKKNPQLIYKLLSAPPGHNKSSICTIGLAAFLLGYDPSNKIVIMSSTEDMATRLFDEIKKVCSSDLYQRVFSNIIFEIRGKSIITISKENNTILGGSIGWASRGSNITGMQINTLILDDINSVADGNVSQHQLGTVKEFLSQIEKRLRGGDKLDGSKILQRLFVVQQLLHPGDITGIIRTDKLYSRMFDKYVLQAEIENFNEIEATGNYPYYQTYRGKFYRKTKMLDDTKLDENRAALLKMNEDDWQLQFQQNLDYTVGSAVFSVEDIYKAREMNTIYNMDNHIQSKEFFKNNLEIIVACDPSQLNSANSDSFGIVVMGYYKKSLQGLNFDNNIDIGEMNGLKYLQDSKVYGDSQSLLYILEDRTVKGAKLSAKGIASKLIAVCQDWNPSKIVYEANNFKNFPDLYKDCEEYCRGNSYSVFEAYNANNGNSTMYKNCLDMRNVYDKIAHITKYKSQVFNKDKNILEEVIIENNLQNLENQIQQMSFDDNKPNKKSNDTISAMSWGFHYFYEKYIKTKHTQKNIITERIQFSKIEAKPAAYHFLQK